MEGNNRRPARPQPPSDIKGHVVSGTTDSERCLRKVKQCHDEAYLYIEQALSCDEVGQKEQSVTLYTKGLRCIDFAYDVWSSNSGLPADANVQKARKLLQKMQQTRTQIQSRVEMLISTDAGVARALDDPPPSYEDATTPTQSDFDMLLDASLMNDGPPNSEGSSASATELFKIDDGVQIFYITKEGYVSAPSYPSSLGIYKFNESLIGVGSGNDMEVAQVFLKVSDWTYPLIPGRSPVLHASWGAYIFPDVSASGDGNSVGVIIPDFVSPAERAKFERTLNSYTVMRDQEQSPCLEERRIAESGASLRVVPPRPVTAPPGESTGEQPTLGEERTSEKISRGLETAAEWISWGFMKGAEKTGELMKKGSAKLQDRLNPDKQPAKIDPRAQKGIYYTRKATEGVVKVSGFLVQKLGQGTMALARKAAPHLQKQGHKYLPASLMQKDPSGHSKMDDVVTVAAGGLKGWATVYVGLEHAAKVLAKNITNETVHVVKHKYGAEAADVTENAMHSGVNLAFTAHYTSSLGATAIAKRAAKDTGVALVEHHNTKKPRETAEVVDKSTELRDS